ncbi:MAG: hypothetical protein ABIQ16_01685 [Polyangiaceae bacterium]
MCRFVLGLGLGLVLVGCSSSSTSAPGSAGAAGVSGRPGDSAEAGAPDDSKGEAGAPDDSKGEAGAAGGSAPVGEAGAAGDSGSNGGAFGAAPPLPEGTLLYVYEETKDNDLLVALDLESGEQRVVTDLTGDGSSGWDIDSYSLSPDRRRIALSSLYGPTNADTATGLATKAIWTLGTNGADFRRLTPTFPKDAQGRNGFQYDVGDPEWTADGSSVVYDFGSYWWEGTTLSGGSFPWIVAADGKSLPSSIPIDAPCSVLYPSRNPVTGDFLLIHSVCVPGQGEGNGLYLYSAEGEAEPAQLVASTHVVGGVDVSLTKPSWFSDGSGFLFVGGVGETDWSPSLLAYAADTGKVSLLVPAPEGTGIRSVAASPDSSKIVYCTYDKESGAKDLHLIDLAPASPTDVAITTDGKSCQPSF